MKVTLDLDVSITCDELIPRVEAYLSGLPENCYPAEAGKVIGMRVWLGDLDITDHIDDRDLKHMEEQYLTEMEDGEYE